MQVLSLRQAALLAAAAAAALAARSDAAGVTASTAVSGSAGVSGTVSAATTTGSTATAAAVSTATTTGSSSSTLDNSAGSVSCVFRYSMPTASNVPSEVAAADSASQATGASGSDASSSFSGYGSYSGSGADGSNASAGTVSLPTSDSGSDSSAASASSSGHDDSSSSKASSASASGSSAASTESTSSKASSSGSGSSTSTNSTPSSTTATPTSTTKTPSSTTATPSSTTKTPSTSSSTTTGSSDTSRRLVGEEAELTVSAGVDSTSLDVSLAGSSSASTTATTPSSTTRTPSSTATSTTTTPSATTATPSSTSATSSSSLSSSSSSATFDASSGSTSSSVTTTGSAGSTTIEFSCDATFYGAWSQMGLTCEGTELDVDAAAASSECLIYSGLASGTEITDMATCMSVCRFPACANGTWDYSAEDGLGSDVYANLDFLTLMSYAGSEASNAVLDAVTQPFSNMTFTAESECEYTSDSSFSTCDCNNLLVSSSPSASGTGTSGTSGTSEYSVPVDKGLEDSNHWADGTTKTTVDKAGIASTTIGSSAATVSVVAGGVMSVASGVVGGTSAGVASGVSAAASVGITMAAVDICQFSIMINQMNVDARPRFLENMGKRMAPAAFSFLPFGQTTDDDSDSSSSGSGSSSTSASGSSTRRLADGSSTSGSTSSGSSSSSTSTSAQGMEKYAKLIGVQADKLFYLAVAGVGCVVACLFLAYGLAMLVCYFIVSDFPSFSRKWFDKAIGVLMMILILSEYVIGGTATYQICYCIDHDVVDVSLFLAIAALLVLAVGTILYGVMIIRNNEDELRDLGTKDHFEKKFHARYGPLYDEHSFEGRFFFAPKLMLALLCGVTTGMIWIEGLWQIVVLIALHIAFLLYLEIKQPYPTAFVQKTSSFVIIIKISALFLSFFLLSSATSFTESIPDDLREGVGFAIVGLQVLVLVCLMIRQIYIFYRTWKLKRDGGGEEDDKPNTVQTANARDGSEAFFALGGEPQYHGQQQHQRGNSLAVLGDSTPRLQDPNQYSQQTPTNAGYGKLRGLQPTGGSGMSRTQSVVTHEPQQYQYHQQHPGAARNNEVDL